MLSIYLTNLGRYVEGYLEGEWLVLPCSVDKLQQTLQNIGINKNYEEWFISDYSCNLQCVCDVIHEYGSITALNELAERLDELTEHELEKLEAIHEAEEFTEVSQLLNASYSLDEWDIYHDVEDEDSLGEYFYYELGAIEIPEKVIGYFDFEAYGRDVHLDIPYGVFTTFGYVTRF